MSDQEFNKIFSKRLKHYLNEYDMTPADLARLLGVSTQSVTNWCKGDKAPRMDKVDTSSNPAYGLCTLIITGFGGGDRIQATMDFEKL